MMQESPLEVIISGTRAKLPAAELLLIHAVYHGDMRVARSDQIQSLIDCRRLMRLVDYQKLNDYCKLENCEVLVQEYLDHVVSITKNNSKFKFTRETIPRQTYIEIRSLSEKIIFHIARLPEVFSARHLQFSDLVALILSRNGEGVLYKAWTVFFQVRFFEEMMSRYFHGFLDDPKTIPLSLISDKEFFDLTDTAYLHTLKGSKISQEWRGKVAIPLSISRILVIMHSLELAQKTFLLFVNGRLLEVASFNNDGYFEFEVSQSGANEISLRSPVRACISCCPNMNNLRILMRKI
jgi:hypothetical protein